MTQNGELFSKDLGEFIKKITMWYETDHEGFRTMYDAAVAHVVPYPDDTPEEVRCDWKNKDIRFLCDFFDEWYKWRSGVNDGLDYIEKFSWLNYENDYGMVFVTSGPGYKMTADFTNLQGKQMDEKGPQAKKLIEKWAKELGEKRMAEYKKEDWETFNDFFVRQLKEPRRVDAEGDDSVVVAPADCVINMIVDDLTEDTPIPVKTVTMNVAQLLGNSSYAERFIGGTAVSCILMPDSYHWYHAPVTGEVVEASENLPGVYYGMRDFPGLLDKGNVGYGYDYSMFDEFRRGYLVIRTKYLDSAGKLDGEGYVGLVPVGLNSIASVNFRKKFRGPIEAPVPVKKGEQIGNFKYGGSLNILLFEKGRFPAVQLLQGQRIGVLEDPQRTAGLFSHSYLTRSQRRRPLAP